MMIQIMAQVLKPSIDFKMLADLFLEKSFEQAVVIVSSLIGEKNIQHMFSTLFRILLIRK